MTLPKVLNWFAPSETLLRIRANQRDLSQHRALARSIALDPVNLLLLFLALLSTMTGFTGLAFKQQPAILNHIVLGSFLVLHVSAQYFWLGRWFQRGIWFGIPILWIYCAFYSTAHVFFHLIFGPLTFDQNMDVSLGRFWRTYPVAMLVTAAYAMSFMARARHMLGEDPSLVPTVWPISARNLTPENKLEKFVGTMPQYMQTGNDGTLIVWAGGQKMVRMPLAKLVDMAAPDQGFHCHRSLWVAKDQVVDVSYLNGNPQVELQGKRYFSISRKAVAQIRQHLDQTPAPQALT